jgi:hypothetical protein
MGKTPLFGMVGFCWLSLALAGCDTTTNNSVPKNKFGGSTFNNAAKDPTVSKVGTPDGAGQTKTVDSFAAQGRQPANAGGSLPDNVGGADTIRPAGMRSPGAAGVAGADPMGLNKPNSLDSNGPTPMTASDPNRDRTTFSTSRAPLSQTRTEPALPPGSTGVALPPPPGSVLPLPVNAPPLKPLSSPVSEQVRPIGTSPTTDAMAPPPPPTLPSGLKPIEPPPAAPGAGDVRQIIYDVPPPAPPSAPLPPAPKVSDNNTTPAIDAPPPPPPGPSPPVGPR